MYYSTPIQHREGPGGMGGILSDYSRRLLGALLPAGPCQQYPGGLLGGTMLSTI